MRKRKAVKRYIVHGAYIETKHCIYCLQKMKVNLCSHQPFITGPHICGGPKAVGTFHSWLYSFWNRSDQIPLYFLKGVQSNPGHGVSGLSFLLISGVALGKKAKSSAAWGPISSSWSEFPGIRDRLSGANGGSIQKVEDAGLIQ